jgi:hypothetical protein
MSSGSAHLYRPVKRIPCHSLRSTPLAPDMMICMMSKGNDPEKAAMYFTSEQANRCRGLYKELPEIYKN